MNKIALLKNDSFINVLGTIAIACLNVSALAGARLVLPMIALGMGASTFMVGLTTSMFTAIPMLLSIPFGRWVDRIGTLIPIVFSCCLIISASALFIFSTTVNALVAVAGLIGAGAFFASATATRGVGDSNNEVQRTKNIGHLVLGYSLFGFLGPIIASASYEHFGSREALLTIGIFGVLSLCLIVTNIHYYKHFTGQHRVKAENNRISELILIKSLRKWISVNAVFATALTLYPFVISLHSIEIGLSPTEAGLTLGAFAVGMMISRTGISVVLKYLQAETLITSALLAAALIYAVLPWTYNFQILTALSIILGMPLGIALPISLSLIVAAAPEDRVNESVGLCFAFTSMLQTIAPLALGVIASGAGSAALTWAVTLILVFGAVMSGKKTGNIS